MTTASLSGELRDLYTEESARIQQQFAVTGDGTFAVRERTRLVETIAIRPRPLRAISRHALCQRFSDATAHDFFPFLNFAQ